MTVARMQERKALSNVASKSSLTLEALVLAPPYFGRVANLDCVYDGSLIELSHRPPVIAEGGGELFVGILGPYWDRVLRIKFFGVTAVNLSGFGPSLSMDIREISLGIAPGCQRCEIHGLSSPAVVSIDYRSARVTRLMLESPVERS